MHNKCYSKYAGTLTVSCFLDQGESVRDGVKTTRKQPVRTMQIKLDQPGFRSMSHQNGAIMRKSFGTAVHTGV